MKRDDETGTFKNKKKRPAGRFKCFHNGIIMIQLKYLIAKNNPTEYAGLRNSSAYSLVVNCLSSSNVKNILKNE
jgi:hypothetical protein